MWRLKGILSAYWKYPTQVPALPLPGMRPQVVQPWAGAWDLSRLEGERSQGADSPRDTAHRFFFPQAVLLKATPKRNARCVTYCIEGIFSELGEKPIGSATCLFPPSVKETLFLGRWRGQRGCCLFACWLYFYIIFCLTAAVRNEKKNVHFLKISNSHSCNK